MHECSLVDPSRLFACFPAGTLTPLTLIMRVRPHKLRPLVLQEADLLPQPKIDDAGRREGVAVDSDPQWFQHRQTVGDWKRSTARSADWLRTRVVHCLLSKFSTDFSVMCNIYMHILYIILASVSSRPSKTGGGIAMFRGEGVWGDRRGGVWRGAVPLPNGGLGAVPPEKIWKLGNKY